MTPKILYCFPDSAGEMFLPSNGTDGMIFTEHFCEQCIHEKFIHTQNDDDLKCDIFTSWMIEGHQKEWVFDYEGWPVCTKWKKWDWGNDRDGWNEPPTPEPINPRQLILPFDLIGVLVGYDDFAVFPTAIIERELIEN